MSPSTPFRLSYGEDLLTELERVAEYYNGRVSRFLGLAPVPHIRLEWGPPDMEHAGESSSIGEYTRIVIHPGYRDGTFDTHPQTLRALMAHEMTHSVIFVNGSRIAADPQLKGIYGDPGTIPWAFQEGMATWVSKTLVLPRGDRRVDWAILQQPGMNPKRDGYDEMAGYLESLNEEQPGVTKRIARQLAYETFTTDTFRRATGRTIHDSLKDYRAGLTQYVPPMAASIGAPAWTRMMIAAVSSAAASPSKARSFMDRPSNDRVTQARVEHQQL